MLRFTSEQSASIIANRRQFNVNQAALAARIGDDTLIGNALSLPKDVWGLWDREGVAIQRQVLSVFNDLATSVSTPMPIGKLAHYFQTISDSGSVNISLDGRSKAPIDKPTFAYYATPVPIVDSSFGYGWREVEAARSEGYQLDAAGRTNANYKVAEKLEDIVLNGDAKIVFNGGTLYGLLNHPKRNTDTHGVDLNGATATQWSAAVNKLTSALYGDNFYTEPTMYVNINDWKYARTTDWSSAYAGKSIAQRMMELGIGSVVPSSKVPANTLIGVIKTTQVVNLLSAMPMATRAQFRANPEDDYDFVTMAAAALEIKYDATNQCGVAVVTKT